LKLVGVTIRDSFEFQLNGSPIPVSQIKRLHSPGGRDPRIHPVPLEPYSQYIIQLGSGLRRGENRLTVSLTQAEPDLFGAIEIREMELFVRYE